MQISQSAPTLQSSQNFSNDDNNNSNVTSSSTAADRVSNELKRMWQNALRACKQYDEDKSGFVKREVFVSIVEQHLGKVRLIIFHHNYYYIYCQNFNICFFTLY